MKVPRCLRSSKFHLYAVLALCVLAVPMWVWWRDSVVLVNLMSWYALVVSHWGGYQAARAEEQIKRGRDASAVD